MKIASRYSKNIKTSTIENPRIHNVQITRFQLNKRLAFLNGSNRYEEALHLFDEVRCTHHHLKPDHYTLSTTLTACAILRRLAFGNKLQAHAIKSGLNAYSHVANTLLLLYAKSLDVESVKRVFDKIRDPDVYSYTTMLSVCARNGDVDNALKMFDEMPHRHVPVWNAMITGFMESGHEEVAFCLFRDMCRLGVRHDNYSFASVLSGCYLEWTDFGRQVHSMVVKTGIMARTSVVNALITMHYKNEDVLGASLVFEEVQDSVRDEITYNVMINGLVGMGRVGKAWILFREMLRSFLMPTELTFVSLLSSCLYSRIGSQIYSQAIRMGFEACTSVSNAAITMYSSCGDLDAAYIVFKRLEGKDIVSWNTVISSYAQGNMGASAILAFLEMQRMEIEPDEFTFGSLLVSSVCIKTVEMIHAVVFRSGLFENVQVANALISAYSKQGEMKEAYKTFCSLTYKNLITWNAMISGFFSNGFPMQGLQQFSELLRSELRPNEYSLSIALSICSSISAIRLGKQVHNYILRYGFTSNLLLGNALMTLYAKCGHLDKSLRMFEALTERDIVSWNSILSAYAQHGKGVEAVQCFELMLSSSDIKPDEASFSALLSACSHGGLVDQGVQIINSMFNCYGVHPGVGHFSIIVDLLGRSGRFEEVEKIITSKHFSAHPDIWWALLSACAAHGNLRLGRLVAASLLQFQKDNPSVYVLLSNAYATAGQWAEAAALRHLVDDVGLKKKPGYSQISC